MGFITKCFIRKNTPELQKKLEDMGYEICPCANFETSAWLDNNIETNSIHGVPAHAIGIMLHEADAIDCGENDKLFLALAAMRDDTQYMQWFICTNSYKDPYNEWKVGDMDVYNCECQFQEPLHNWRRATAEEIVKHYTNE